MTFLDFNEISVGERRSIIRKITDHDVESFVSLTGDNNPLHVDRDYAVQTPFHGRVVHGMLGASFVSTVIGTQLPGPGALWLAQSFEFLLPVRVGDSLTISCTVTAKHERDRVLDVDAAITNQDGREVLRGRGRIRVLEPVGAAVHDAAPHRTLTALITGASGGIGRAVAVRLAGAGHHLLLHYRSNADDVERIADEIAAMSGSSRPTLVGGDLGNERELRAVADTAIAARGAVDILVNAASSRVVASGIDVVEWQAMEAQLDINLRAPLVLAQRCIPAMKERGWGRIVNVVSDESFTDPTDGWVSYGVAKAAMASLTRYQAAELGRHGITANAVAPGMCRTPFLMDIAERAQLIAARGTPNRRIAVPDDVAHAVEFLVSDGSGHINGQTLHVNGGAWMP